MAHSFPLPLTITSLLAAAAIALCTGAAGAKTEKDLISLASNGKPLCQIVVSSSASESERIAAGDLSRYLGKVIGSAPSIVNEPGDSRMVRLSVGRTAKAEGIAASDIARLGADGIVIKSNAQDIILTGFGPRGTFYAVYTFLEDVIGCRWYAIDADEVIPAKPNLAIPAQNVVYTPPFEYRLTFTEAIRDPMLRLKLRVNGTDFTEPIPDNYGGGISFGEGHSLINRFLKPADFFDKHPEWYAFRKAENKRVPTQVCLTNPEARQVAAEEVIAYIRKTNTKIVSVSLSDTDAICQCENCTAVAEREGSYSGPLLEFVNYVAVEVAKQFPDVTVSTLAYWVTERPPKFIKPNKNVLLIFAVLDRNHKHDLSQVPNDSRYLDEWRNMSSKVYMWDYDPAFGNFIQPHPNHLVFPRSLRFYKKMKVDGVFVQGSWGAAGEFMHMRGWVNAHMMWNPDLDARALMCEFASAYYGKAGPILIKYIDLIDKAINRQPNTWLGVYGSDTSNWLTLDDLNAATRLFDQAQKAVAGNKAELYRVRRARLSIEVVWLQRYREFRYEADRRHCAFLGPEDVFAALDQFKKNEFGVNSYREWGDLAEYSGILSDLLLPPSGKTPTQCKSLKSCDWVDISDRLLKATEAKEAVQIDDPAASDGKSLVLKGFSTALQACYDVPRHLAGRWRVYVVLRCKPAGNVPVGVAVGIYSPRELCRTTAEFDANTCETYQTVDLGAYELSESAKIWVQPNGAGSFGEKESTRIDRVFLVHLDSQPKCR